MPQANGSIAGTCVVSDTDPVMSSVVIKGAAKVSSASAANADPSGLGDGITVGIAVGIADANAVGAADGIALGIAVGIDVGIAVGAGVKDP